MKKRRRPIPALNFLLKRFRSLAPSPGVPLIEIQTEMLYQIFFVLALGPFVTDLVPLGLGDNFITPHGVQLFLKSPLFQDFLGVAALGFRPFPAAAIKGHLGSDCQKNTVIRFS
ncbi:MAG: hypothetical protein HGA66_07620 [Holophaga sp.]|nr:hypothetical protein [Holophaga sp.]